MVGPDYIPIDLENLPGGKPVDTGHYYDLLAMALSLGGRVVTVQPGPWHPQRLEQGVPEPEEPSLCFSGEGSGAGLPLSKAHIRPHVQFRAGASLLRSHIGGVKPDQMGGGKRGMVEGFSGDARRRLMYLIAGVRRDAGLPLFVTLTYPESFPDPKDSKRHLKMFFQRLTRAYPSHGSVWKLEPQQRGAPHYHILIWGCDLVEMMKFIPWAWFEIAGAGDVRHLMWHVGALGNGNLPCVQQVHSFKGVMAYASKYLGKTFIDEVWGEKWTGRYWGVVNRDCVPLGELVEQEIASSKALELRRYQRRFSKLKNFRSNKSFTIFCDADQWIDKVIGGEILKTDIE